MQRDTGAAMPTDPCGIEFMQRERHCWTSILYVNFLLVCLACSPSTFVHCVCVCVHTQNSNFILFPSIKKLVSGKRQPALSTLNWIFSYLLFIYFHSKKRVYSIFFCLSFSHLLKSLVIAIATLLQCICASEPGASNARARITLDTLHVPRAEYSTSAPVLRVRSEWGRLRRRHRTTPCCRHSFVRHSLLTYVLRATRIDLPHTKCNTMIMYALAPSTSRPIVRTHCTYSRHSHETMKYRMMLHGAHYTFVCVVLFQFFFSFFINFVFVGSRVVVRCTAQPSTAHRVVYRIECNICKRSTDF